MTRARIMAVVLCLGWGVVSEAAGWKWPWSKPKTFLPPIERPEPEPVKSTLDAIPESCKAALSDGGYRLLAEALSKAPRNIAEKLQQHGLSLSTVSWQDTGRATNSAYGANIADVRLAAITQTREGKSELFAQPIARLPNFDDKTVDIDLEKVWVPVGNTWGSSTFTVPLKMLLENPTPFLSGQEVLAKGSLWRERDSQVLVSAQAAIMPVPKKGQAHFAPSIFSYSGSKGNPASLVILVSNLGTSMTVVDNARDKLSDNGMHGSGQLLFHNKNGEKAPFTLEALKDVTQTAEGQSRVEKLEKSGQAVAGVSGVNQVLMIQVPLVHKKLPRVDIMFSFSPLEALTTRGGGDDPGLDIGVVGVADYTLGKFVELDGLGATLERDPGLPIRVDVVRYLAVSTPELTESEIERLPKELEAIYAAGDNLGSLVTGPTAHRVTRNYRPQEEPWWRVKVIPWFPPRWEGDQVQFFRNTLGPDWQYRFATEEAAAETLAQIEPPK